MVYPKLLRFLKAHICTTPGPACTDPIRKLECILRCVDTAKYCTSVLPGAQANPQTGPPVNIMHMRSVIVRRKNKHCEYSQDFLPFFFRRRRPELYSVRPLDCVLSFYRQQTNSHWNFPKISMDFFGEFMKNTVWSSLKTPAVMKEISLEGEER